MSDTGTMASNIRTGLNPNTTKLEDVCGCICFIQKANSAQSQFLKTLGYNLNPSTWPELQVLYHKALEEDNLLRSLYITIKEQRDRARDQLKQCEGDKKVAQNNLVCGIAQLFKKFSGCWLAVSKVQVMASEQSGIFLAATRDGDFEVDSLLVPGKRITLNHDEKEMEDFFQSIGAWGDGEGKLGEEESLGSNETDSADSDGFQDEAEFWFLGDSPDVSRSFEV